MLQTSTDVPSLNHFESIFSLAITSTKEPVPSLAKLAKQKNDINVANSDGDVLLVAASYFGDIELVRLMLKEETLDINKTDSNGFSSICWAMRNGHRNVVVLLLEQPNLALTDLDLVEDLLNDSGADTDIKQLTMRHPSFDINMRSPEGDTLLMRTCHDDKYIKVTQELLKSATIDINAVNSIWMTAYKYTTYYVDGAPLTQKLLAADVRCITDEPPKKVHSSTSTNEAKTQISPSENTSSLELDYQHRINFTITVSEKTTKGLTDSKLGGAPYWPISQWENYPMSISGQPFVLLAQVNFNEIKESKELEPYWPTSGLLQFYINTIDPNMLYGCNLIDPLDRSGFRVVYHAKFDEESIPGKPISRYLGGTSPFHSDEQWNILEFQVHDDTPGVETLEHSFLESQGSNSEESIDPIEQEPASKLGWFPNFMQSDPRDSVENILLFQLVSNKYVSFWDAWIMNFFIRANDLKNRDFSKMIFNWDCL